MRRGLIVAAAAVLAGAALVPIINSRVEGYARKRVVEELQRRYSSDLEFASLEVKVLPRILVEAEKLVFRHKGRRDAPPLITIDRLTARTGVLQLLRSPKHVTHVRFENLVITVPPRRGDKTPDEPKEKRADSPVVVDEIVCDAALVRILPKTRGKEPLQYRIHHVRMESVGLDRPAPFRATLTNARPPGEIAVRGEFGPWRSDDAGRTPLGASYEFQKANLADFKGIAGTLSSTGQFSGVLERIVVDGETNTPDFMVRVSGHRVPLYTKFRAIVDGTTGDTLLKPVRARVLDSWIMADGGVVQKPGRKGKTVALDVVVEDARLQDILKLAVKSARPPLTGRISFRTEFELPPGDGDIAERLQLAGRFGIDDAEFTEFSVQEKVDELSRKGRGEADKGGAEDDRAVSDLRGAFRMAGGVIRFTGLNFSVPGAAVNLNGSYDLADEALDFRGHLRLAAKLSETTTGVKSFFLKLVEPFFEDEKAGAGTVLPIRVTGTREEPDFGVEIGRALTGN